MSISALISSGNVDGAMQAAKAEAQKDPANGSHRLVLFQVACVQGDWAAAKRYLDVALSLDPENALFSTLYGRAVDCELERSRVFGGEANPVFLGEPAGWQALLVQSLSQTAQGEFSAAAESRSAAFEAADAKGGRANGSAFAWFADCDERFGPVVEAFLEGAYRWIPVSAIRKLTIDKPSHIVDLVWAKCSFEWTNLGTATGLIPVRYPGSEKDQDPLIRVARSTRWDLLGNSVQVGAGQRVFATDNGEYPVLEGCTIEFGD